MHPRLLKTFLAVARTRNVTRAAAEVNLAQSSVSDQIQALEAELGANLFTRSRRGLELTPTGYRIGTRQVEGTNLGLQLCYPSPFADDRMIVVQSGLYWGEALPVNHKFDLIPDYIVYDAATDPSDSTNRALVAGFFDGNWAVKW